MAKQLNHAAYTVAWICPLEVEQIAAMEMLDEEHVKLPQKSADHNVYNLGSINGHNVVIAGLHLPGNCPAAAVVAQMKMTFPNLKFGLLVGIGGGVPQTTNNGMIRLGHVVVSKPTGVHSGAVQYDHGKARDGYFERTGALAPPPAALLNAARALAVYRARADNDPVQEDVRRINTGKRSLRHYRFPGVENDHLYKSNHKHLQPGVSCDQSRCDPSQRIQRSTEDDNTFVVVHRGTIASGELVVKDAMLRDTLAQQDGLLCFEMEAAGALAGFPCMVIRGISDYCDSHKNDQWHGYAAATAAAYARQLFHYMPINETQPNPVCAANPPTATFTLALSLPGVTEVQQFVARGAELTRLHEALKHNGDRRTVVLHGLGGMGKTQLTIAYIKKHRDDYSAVIWLNATDETSLRQSFQRAAQRILYKYPSVGYLENAMTNLDLDEIVRAVKRWLDQPSNNRWLIVYDNYDHAKFEGNDVVEDNDELVAEGIELNSGKTSQRETEASKAYDIRMYLPETEHGAILITSRLAKIQIGNNIQLRKMDEIDDSLAILASTSNRTNLRQDPAAIELAQQLDGLPLALSTAGAYLNQVSTSFEEYLNQYKSSWLHLQKSSPQLRSYHQAMFSTWNISYAHIKRQIPESASLLKFWAYFDNGDLWYELLREGGPSGPAWLQNVTEDKITFDAAMRVLCDHGLVDANPSTKEPKEESPGYSVHGCVHSWMTYVLNTEVNVDMAWLATECIVLHVPEDEQPGYWWQQQRLLKHSDRCLTWSSQWLELLQEARAMHVLGDLNESQGRFAEAEAMYERALQGREKALGPDHTSTLTTVNNLGILYKAQGRLAEAEAMYKRALQGKEKALGPDHTSTLNTVNNLGLLYEAQGRLAEAEAMYERALQGYEKALGLVALKTFLPALNTLQNFGNLCKDLGRIEEAVTYYKQAHTGIFTVFGPQHDRYEYLSEQLSFLRLSENDEESLPAAEHSSKKGRRRKRRVKGQKKDS
ncbi:NB-ARC and TPR domain protein [Colletotrichum truncatum]|uniref:NB-ARC and TPR domain protein n=1 Tax=Colletotrichum truncatum TaxID=5467 RepID=A0ACC3Z5B2_COLTU|nr:NB-ARC and TPR domain protein [Colletotrichum truncatum]KAF6795112.1 NB-ARC and TPR domain protein [Colletotrichum truncatum]